MADCPGHEQYTRNMVTGASTANAVIILIDARKGVLQQTRRHTHIISLLRLPHLIVAINKMDLVDFDEATFLKIKEELTEFCARQNIHDLICVPVSALAGDMVVDRGANMDWYKGQTVLETLEGIEVSGHIDECDFRFPVQYVSRPQTKELPDFRGFMGRIASGTVKPGDEIMQLPAGKKSKVKEIITFDGNLDEAFAPQSVTITLEDEIDISRGDTLVHADKAPQTAKEIEAIVCWMGDEPLSPRKKYLIKHTTNTVKAMVSEIQYRTDINELSQDASASELAMNEIGKVSLTLTSPLTFDRYEENRTTGSFIIIDSFTNNTVGAAMIC